MSTTAHLDIHSGFKPFKGMNLLRYPKQWDERIPKFMGVVVFFFIYTCICYLIEHSVSKQWRHTVSAVFAYVPKKDARLIWVI